MLYSIFNVHLLFYIKGVMKQATPKDSFIIFILWKFSF